MKCAVNAFLHCRFMCSAIECINLYEFNNERAAERKLAIAYVAAYYVPCCLQPYHVENASSRLIAEAKQR